MTSFSRSPSDRARDLCGSRILPCVKNQVLECYVNLQNERDRYWVRLSHPVTEAACLQNRVYSARWFSSCRPCYLGSALWSEFPPVATVRWFPHWLPRRRCASGVASVLAHFAVASACPWTAWCASRSRRSHQILFRRTGAPWQQSYPPKPSRGSLDDPSKRYSLPWDD